MSAVFGWDSSDRSFSDLSGLLLWLTGLPVLRSDPLPISYLLALPLLVMASFNFICRTSAFVASSRSSSRNNIAPATGMSS